MPISCRVIWQLRCVASAIIIFFLDSRKLHPPKSAFCEFRWVSKILVIPDSYKRCTPWLELKIYCEISSLLSSRHAPWKQPALSSLHNLINMPFFMPFHIWKRNRLLIHLWMRLRTRVPVYQWRIASSSLYVDTVCPIKILMKWGALYCVSWSVFLRLAIRKGMLRQGL